MESEDIPTALDEEAARLPEVVHEKDAAFGAVGSHNAKEECDER